MGPAGYRRTALCCLCVNVASHHQSPSGNHSIS